MISQSAAFLFVLLPTYSLASFYEPKVTEFRFSDVNLTPSSSSDLDSAINAALVELIGNTSTVGNTSQLSWAAAWNSQNMFPPMPLIPGPTGYKIEKMLTEDSGFPTPIGPVEKGCYFPNYDPLPWPSVGNSSGVLQAVLNRGTLRVGVPVLPNSETIMSNFMVAIAKDIALLMSDKYQKKVEVELVVPVIDKMPEAWPTFVSDEITTALRHENSTELDLALIDAALYSLSNNSTQEGVFSRDIVDVGDVVQEMARRTLLFMALHSDKVDVLHEYFPTISGILSETCPLMVLRTYSYIVPRKVLLQNPWLLPDNKSQQIFYSKDTEEFFSKWNDVKIGVVMSGYADFIAGENLKRYATSSLLEDALEAGEVDAAAFPSLSSDIGLICEDCIYIARLPLAQAVELSFTVRPEKPLPIAGSLFRSVRGKL